MKHPLDYDGPQVTDQTRHEAERHRLEQAVIAAARAWRAKDEGPAQPLDVIFAVLDVLSAAVAELEAFRLAERAAEEK